MTACSEDSDPVDPSDPIGPRSRTLTLVRQVTPPADGLVAVSVDSAFDGSLEVTWRVSAAAGRDRARWMTLEGPDGLLASIREDSLHLPVRPTWVVPLPGGRWLAVGHSIDWQPGERLPGNAWVVSAEGALLASGYLGAGIERPTVGLDGTIWATYDYWSPERGHVDIRQDATGRFWVDRETFVPSSAVPEQSDRGRYSVGFAGMAVFDSRLWFVGRHETDTPLGSLLWTHTDGTHFWYQGDVWETIDVWGPGGQGEPIDSEMFPEDLSDPEFLATTGGLARFVPTGPGAGTLWTCLTDGSLLQEQVVLPDGAEPPPDATVLTWGEWLSYVDIVDEDDVAGTRRPAYARTNTRRVDWYRLDVFAEAARGDAGPVPGQFDPAHAASTNRVSEADALCTLSSEIRAGSRYVAFGYPSSAGRVGRLVEPVSLVLRSRRRYLRAWDIDRWAWRKFRVDRMSWIRPAGRVFRTGAPVRPASDHATAPSPPAGGDVTGQPAAEPD